MMITGKAKRKMALFLKEFFDKANVGNGGNTTGQDANDLDIPLLTTRKTTGNSESFGSAIDFAVTFTGNEVQGNTIREFGIFSESMPTDSEMGEIGDGSWNANNSDSTMLARVNFEALGPFSTNDSLEFILVVEVE